MGTANIHFNGQIPKELDPMARFSEEQKREMMKLAAKLKQKHPGWKPEKVMRKVCEEYSIKLDLSDGKKLNEVLKKIADESSSSRPIPARLGRVNAPGKSNF